MANTRISDLTASASNLASTDLAPVVQTAGVGPVKMTGAQIAAGLLSATTPIGSGPILSRGGSATLQLGAADTTGTTAPTAQFLRVQSWSSSTNNNQTGADFTIQGSRGTGTGAGGSIIFQVAPAGGSSNGVQNAYSTALTIDSTRLATFAGDVGLYSSNTLRIGSTSVNWQLAASTTGVILGANSYLGFYSVTNIASAGSVDVTLFRDAANTLALRNGTNAQQFNIYNSYTDASNNEFARFVWSSNIFIINTTKAGTGTSRDIQITPGGNLYLGAGGISNAWKVDTANHISCTADNTYDIGLSGAKPRYIRASSAIVTPSTTVASLPSASTAGSGARSFVTDATATTYLSTVAGGGANKVPVVSDGTNWLIG